MSLDTNGMSAADVAAVVGNNRNNDGFGFGGDGAYLLLFLLLAMNGGFGGGMFGGFGNMWNGSWWNMEAAPYFYNMQTQNEVARGFDQSATANALNNISTAVTTGFAGVNQGMCSGFAGVNATVNNGFANAETAANARQMANMQTAFNAQSAMSQGFNQIGAQFADCCCENRLANCQTQNIIQNEGNATRFADANNTRDIIQSQTSGTQAILDKLCQLELDGVKAQVDAKNDRIAELQSQLNMANLAASQTAQNAFIANEINQQNETFYNRLSTCPIPSTPVYERQNIFTCPNNNYNYGCGCNG